MRIVGISGSPVKAGNPDTFLTYIMTLAQEKGLCIETIHLAEYDIQHCTH
jgi:multimeric flavodoxin WrbA